MPASEKSARSLREKVFLRNYFGLIYFVLYTQGMVLCDPALPVPVTTKFQAKIVVFSIEVPITKGIARRYKLFQ
jgi:hypothetical protein